MAFAVFAPAFGVFILLSTIPDMGIHILIKTFGKVQFLGEMLTAGKIISPQGWSANLTVMAVYCFLWIIFSAIGIRMRKSEKYQALIVTAACLSGFGSLGAMVFAVYSAGITFAGFYVESLIVGTLGLIVLWRSS